MGVGVNKPRCKRFPHEIDDPCRVADIAGDRLVVARIKDSAMLHRKRLNNGSLMIDGNDFSVF